VTMTDVPRGYQYVGGTDFSLGNVFSLSFSILGAHFLQFALLSAISSIPILVFLFLFPDAAPGHSGAAASLPPGAAIAALLSALLLFPMMFLGQATVLFGAFQDMLGRPVRILPSLGVGLARIFPVIGMFVVQLAGILLGFALLVIPGIVLGLAWSVALPACVVEKLGPIGSLKRSWTLTKGHRWKLFAIYISYGVGGMLANGAVNGVLNATGEPLASATGSFVWEALYLAYAAILSVVVYRDLRVTKENLSTEQIAAMFE